MEEYLQDDCKAVYNMYVDLLYYVYCPEKMQTVSLVEKIFYDASVVWLLNIDSSLANVDLYEKMFGKARDYIALVFNLLSNREEMDFKHRKAPIDYLMGILKTNARSKAVKDFFEL